MRTFFFYLFSQQQCLLTQTISSYIFLSLFVHNSISKAQTCIYLATCLKKTLKCSLKTLIFQTFCSILTTIPALPNPLLLVDQNLGNTKNMVLLNEKSTYFNKQKLKM